MGLWNLFHMVFADASLQFSVKAFNLIFEELAEITSFSLKRWRQKAVLYSELVRVEMQVFHLSESWQH